MFHPNGPSLIELAQQALSETTRGYDLLAQKFEFTPFRTPEVLLNEVVKTLASGPPIRTALDACCGTGAGLRSLRPLCSERLVGVDLSQGMLDQARALLDQEPGVPVTLRRGDILNLHDQDAYDVITCFGAFGHILGPQQHVFARCVFNALTPGGRFVFITHLMPPPLSARWLIARSFNATMHLRNALISPPFVMFYLSFTLERALDVLGAHPFHFQVLSPWSSAPWQHARLVIATKT